MDIDTQSKVDKEDRRLTRADVEQLLHEAGSPDKLNLSGRNLKAVDLVGLDLRGADLGGANLYLADLSGANLRGAIGLVMESANVEDSTSALHLRITEEPLTAHNFTTILSALTELHAKAWLIQQGRFSDLINYAQTRDTRFTKEANLTIGKLSHDSPALVELLLNPATLTAAAAGTVTLATALKRCHTEFCVMA